MSEKPIKKKPEQAGKADTAKAQTSETPGDASTVTGHYQPVTQPSAPSQPDTAVPGLTQDDPQGGAESEKPASRTMLLVQSVSPNGFWRCGQWWSHAGVRVVVDDGLKVDIMSPYISEATAERLKAEPHIRVTVLDDAGTKDQEA